MKQHVTVIPEDRIIIVDRIPVNCDIETHQPNIHAIQWHNGTGWIEYCENGQMLNITATYPQDVAPYVTQWEQAVASQLTATEALL